MEKCRGCDSSVLIVSLDRLPSSMDTACAQCSCPCSTMYTSSRQSRIPGAVERRGSFADYNALEVSFSERKTESEYSCCSEMKKTLSSRSIKRFFRFFRISTAFGERSNFSMCARKILFIFLIILNLLVVGASPTHRVRHRHLRNVLHAERLCDSPGAIDHPTHDQCSTMSRVRRDVHTMSLREGQRSSLCPYSVCVDEDSARRPVHIHRVYCLQSGCQCTQEGAYRCTQLYNKVEVWYPNTNTTQLLDVEYGCVCAAKHGSTVDPFVPETGDK